FLHGLGGRGLVHRDEDRLALGDQGGTLRQLDVGRGDGGAGLGVLDADVQFLGDVQRVDLDGDVVDLLQHQRAGGRVAGDDHRDVDRDPLALLDDQQVDVLDVVLQRVHGDVLGERQLRLVAVDVQRQHGVVPVVTDHPGELDGGQRQVLRVGAVAVEHRGDLACLAG